MDDCVVLLNTSNNIETVINRYDGLLEVLARLSKYEGDPSVSFSGGELPSVAISRIQNEKATFMIGAIQRCYANVLEKSATLKTEKARNNRLTKFFDLLVSHASDFPPETNDFIHTLANEDNKEE